MPKQLKSLLKVKKVQTLTGHIIVIIHCNSEIGRKMPVCQKEVTVRNNIWNNVCLIILPVKEKSAYAFLIFFIIARIALNYCI